MRKDFRVQGLPGLYAKSKKSNGRPRSGAVATCGWRGKVLDCPQLIQIFRNSRSLYIIHSQTPSFMPLKIRKVQLAGGTFASLRGRATTTLPVAVIN